MACQWGKNRKNFSLGRERRWHPRLGIAFVGEMQFYCLFGTENLMIVCIDRFLRTIKNKALLNGESLHFGDLLDITLAHGALITSVQNTNYSLKIDSPKKTNCFHLFGKSAGD